MGIKAKVQASKVLSHKGARVISVCDRMETMALAKNSTPAMGCLKPETGVGRLSAMPEAVEPTSTSLPRKVSGLNSPPSTCR